MARMVLVVDDDASFRNLASRILVSWGHVVVAEAENVEGALARAIELRPDVVLADIGLPDGDGFQLAHLLSAMDWQPAVVLISSDSDAANGAAAVRAGARGFLPKDELSGAAAQAMIAGG